MSKSDIQTNEEIFKEEEKKSENEIRKNWILESTKTNNNPEFSGYFTGIMPRYASAQYTPKDIAENIGKSERVKAYLRNGGKAVLFTSEEKKAQEQLIRRFILSKNSILISDFCNSLYRYITDKKNDKYIERLRNQEDKLQLLRITLPFSTIRKIMYGTTLIDNKAHFRYGTATLMNKHVEPSFINMITQETSVPSLLTRKAKSNKNDEILFFRNPITFNEIDQRGNITIHADPYFFLLNENSEGGYLTSNQGFIPMFSGLYPQLILGHALEIAYLKKNKKNYENLPSPVTAYRYYTLLQCAYCNQSIAGIQREIDKTLNKNRINIRLDRKHIFQMFNIKFQIKNNKVYGYANYNEIIKKSNICGKYLLNSINYMGTFAQLQKQPTAKKMFLPAIERSVQFINPLSPTGVFAKADNIKNIGENDELKIMGDNILDYTFTHEQLNE